MQTAPNFGGKTALKPSLSLVVRKNGGFEQGQGSTFKMSLEINSFFCHLSQLTTNLKRFVGATGFVYTALKEWGNGERARIFLP